LPGQSGSPLVWIE
jgi:hypothetical protein